TWWEQGGNTVEMRDANECMGISWPITRNHATVSFRCLTDNRINGELGTARLRGRPLCRRPGNLIWVMPAEENEERTRLTLPTQVRSVLFNGSFTEESHVHRPLDRCSHAAYRHLALDPAHAACADGMHRGAKPGFIGRLKQQHRRRTRHAGGRQPRLLWPHRRIRRQL